jgi:precorrin-2 methylase
MEQAPQQQWQSLDRVLRQRVAAHKRGSLTIVGTGLHAGQITMAALGHIMGAEKLFYAVADTGIEDWLKTLNPTAEDLQAAYKARLAQNSGKDRRGTYDEMVAQILAAVRSGLNVVAAFYGSASTMSYPAHHAFRVARLEGYEATMLPAVSSVESLLADLQIDLTCGGCQIFLASDFVTWRRKIDPTSHLILMQFGFMGEGHFTKDNDTDWMHLLIEALSKFYELDHKVVVYQAARGHPVKEAIIRCVPLSKLIETDANAVHTLYVPPAKRRFVKTQSE